MTTTPVFVGLDVARATLDVALRPSGEPWSVANDEAGMSITGHKTEKMYLRYRQVRREEQAAALAKIAE